MTCDQWEKPCFALKADMTAGQFCINTRHFIETKSNLIPYVKKLPACCQFMQIDKNSGNNNAIII